MQANDMFRTVSLLTLAVLNAVMLSGQQASTLQPPQEKVGPCVTPSAPPVPQKGIKIHPPSWLQKAIAKQQAKIEQQTGIHVDPPTIPLHLPEPKPCTPATPITQPKTQQ